MSALIGPHDTCSTAATMETYRVRYHVENGAEVVDSSERVGDNATRGDCVYGIELGASRWTFLGEPAQTALELGYGRAYDGRISALARWYPATHGWGGFLDFEFWRARGWGFAGRTQLGVAVSRGSFVPIWLGFEFGLGGPFR